MIYDETRLFRYLSGVAKGQEGAGSAGMPHGGPVVTISRACGCGGEEIAQLLAERLGVCCFDKELLDTVICEAKLTRETVERLDEHLSEKLEGWVFGTLFGRNSPSEDYWRCLSRVILSIGEHGGVIVGRGSHLILARTLAYRVRLTGSPEVCARRVAVRERISRQEALERVQKTNKDRAAFIKAHFGRAISDESAFDLILNTDRLEAHAAANVIQFAMEQAGCAVPQQARNCRPGTDLNFSPQRHKDTELHRE